MWFTFQADIVHLLKKKNQWMLLKDGNDTHGCLFTSARFHMFKPLSFRVDRQYLCCFSLKKNNIKATWNHSEHHFLSMLLRLRRKQSSSSNTELLLTCLLVLSSCGTVRCVMRSNNSLIPPGGARSTADGQIEP